TTGINHLLLAGIERVAAGTDVQVDGGFGSGASFDHVATAAVGDELAIGGMDIRFHGVVLNACIPPPGHLTCLPCRAPYAVGLRIAHTTRNLPIFKALFGHGPSETELDLPDCRALPPAPPVRLPASCRGRFNHRGGATHSRRPG